jgi:OPA family sugar phosphate sensor protein UhpC-like MFS transporter
MAVLSPRNRWTVVTALIGGYIGIYLCRKNLSVAVTLLQEQLNLNKAEVGTIATFSTVAYAAGKLLLAPVVDRVGGRRGFLAALVAVAVFGAASALAPGLAVLTIIYSLNRFAGAGGWPSMMKLVPTWFAPAETGRVTAILSLSYLAGGILASLLAGQIAAVDHDWRAVMAFPSIVLVVIAAACAVLVRPGPLVAKTKATQSRASLSSLLLRPQFILVCLLSIPLTMVRETFLTWGVDFLSSIQTGEKSIFAAALGSSFFDLAGFASILAVGFAWDLAGGATRRWLLFSLLSLLAIVLVILPSVGPGPAAALIFAAGLLTYGPYSLLAGTLAVSTGGPARAATASGVNDAVGYAGATLIGTPFGHLLDIGGYQLGFRGLAGLAAVSALLALAYREPDRALASETSS